jgi:hypothetical protein
MHQHAAALFHTKLGRDTVPGDCDVQQTTRALFSAACSCSVQLSECSKLRMQQLI